MNRARLSRILAITSQIHKITLAYFLFLALMFSTLASQMQQPTPQLRAAVCSLPTTIDSTIEITPTNEDNIIDCSSQNITITTTGKLILKSAIISNATVADDKGVHLKVANLVIEEGGEINSSGQGYSVGSLDAFGSVLGSATASTGNAAGSGGGHGGAGGAGNTSGGNGVVLGATGSSFGLLETPMTLGGAGGAGGMGGAGGVGGGAMRIEATGTVTINGSIVADGLAGEKSGDGVTSGGGGAGGSVWIQADILTGNGTVSAKGGNSDNTASFVGGGGGGGRIVMICNSSISYSGVVSVSKGLGSQNGQDGFKIGPGCAPASPTILKIFESSNTAGRVNRALEVSDLTTSRKITFASNLQGNNEKLQVELRQKNDSFQNIATVGQVSLSGDRACENLPLQNELLIGDYCGYAEVVDLVQSTQYKWQARVVNSSGVYSPWVQFGNNEVSDTDFIVVGPIAGVVAIEGNGLTGIAGQPLSPSPRVRVVDAAGYGIPFMNDISWRVDLGGGVLTNVQSVTDKWGEATASWTLGSGAGISNNRIYVWKYWTGYGVSLTASSIPDQVVSYQVTPSTTLSLVDANFGITVRAKDRYGNIVPYSGAVTLYPVSSYDQSSPGLGTLLPTTITLNDGIGMTSAATYSYTEIIQIKVVDENGMIGVSPSIMFVNQLGTCPGILIDQDVTWSASSVPGGVFDCRGLGQLTVTSGATLTLAGYDNGDGDWSNDYGVTILADHILVETGAKISADSAGYAVNRGPGAGNCAGASYGGYGGNGPYVASRTPYGSIYGGVLLGSGASERGSGGGGIRLSVSGTLTVDGSISANAYSGALGCWSSTASGGSVWIETTTLASTTGAGTIAAISEVGRGSGGRIALYYADTAGFVLGSSHIKAYGGSQNDGFGQGGGAGTVYLEQLGVDTSQQGTLLIDSRSSGNPRDAYVPAGNYVFKKIIATRRGHVLFKGDASTGTLQLSSKEGMQGDNTLSRITIEGTFKYIPENPGEILEIEGVDLGLKGDVVGLSDVVIGQSQTSGVTLHANTWAHNDQAPWQFGNVTVGANGVLYMQGYDNGDSNWTNDYGVSLSVNNMTVASGGRIDAVARGYGNGRGAGAAWCGGASYGGYGGNSPGGAGGVPYGTIYGSLALGSGTDNERGSGIGGGALKLTVAGELVVDGTIDTSAVPNNYGCWYSSASGGSIWIDANKISSTTGNPLIQSNGGGYAIGAGRGSGGRIAIYYSTLEGFALNENTVKAIGGRYGNTGYGRGGSAGTIYLEQKGVDAPQQGTLLVTNDNFAAAPVEGAFIPAETYKFKEIRALRGGSMTFAGNASQGRLILENASSLVGSGNIATITINGVLEYDPIEAGTDLLVDSVNLALAGDVQGVSGIVIGQSQTSAVTLHANTWAHNDQAPWQFGNVTVGSNGVLYMQSYDNGDSNWTNDYGVSLSVENLTVATGGRIDSVSRGYGAGRGAGAAWCGGGSYGGYGGNSPGGAGGVPYGTIYGSLALGSGSDNGEISSGVGGGAMKLTVANELRIDGIIDVSADPTRYGCWQSSPSGGSIWIDTNKISSATGNPLIQSNGGGYAAGTGRGSGGRIAIYYSTLEGFSLDENTVKAIGGRYGNTGYGRGGSAGTIYLEQKGVDAPQQGTLLVSNDNFPAAPAGGAYLPADNYTFSAIRLVRMGHVTFDGNQSTGIVEVTEDTINADSISASITVKGLLRNIGSQPFNIKNNVHLMVEGALENIESIAVGKSSVGQLTLAARTWHYSNANPYQFSLLDIGANGTVFAKAYDNGDSDWSNDHGLHLETINLNIDAEGKISATGFGYSGYRGPGFPVEAGGNHGGASYGGYGYPGTNGHRAPYGSIYEPTNLGSGGYHTSPGGGAVKVSVTGTATINGNIEALGAYVGTVSGGTGGSIWLETDELTGTGKLLANAPNGTTWDGGGSAGGRIALYYRTNNGFDLSTASLQARGGTGSRGHGGPGTVYIENIGTDEPLAGRLLVNNNGVAAQSAGVIEGSYKLRGIELNSYGSVKFLGNSGVLEITSPSGFSGDETRPSLVSEGTLKYTGEGTFTIDGVDVGIAGKLEGIDGVPVTAVDIGKTSAAGLTLNAHTWYHNKDNYYQIDSLNVGPYGVLTLVSYDDGDSIWTDDYGVTLRTNTFTVEEGGLVTATGKGYSGYRGPGAAVEAGGNHSGASHGGFGYYGTNGVRESYGNFYEPVDLGSGGYTASAGGGAMHIIANSSMTVNGNIESLGQYTGGVNSGAGGSIWLETDEIAGSGKILTNAHNGTAWDGGGSAGGRIALYYRSNNGFDLSKTSLQSRGGTGSRGHGGPGTVYIEQRGVDLARGGSLLIDNNDIAARTGTMAAGDYTFNDVTIGQNVSMWVKSDTKAVVENSVLPATHGPIKTDDSLALLRFDDTGYADASSNNLDAMQMGGVTVSEGKFGRGQNVLRNQAIIIPEVTLPDSYTIDMWAKFPLPTTPDGWRTAIGRRYGNLHPILVESTGRLGLYQDGFFTPGYNVNALSAGWHHIAVTASGTTSEFFVDGVSVGTVSKRATGVISYLGNVCSDSTCQQPFGMIDAVRISNTVLSAEDLLAAANSEVAPTPTANTLALWQLDETGFSYVDSSMTQTMPGFAFGEKSVPGVYGNALQFNGYNSQLISGTSVTTPIEYTLEVRFKTNTTVGGKLIGFSDSPTATYYNDRTMYLSNDGKINFGMYNSHNNRVITSTNSYNDNEWHYAIATFSTTSGMMLYVDGQLVASNTADKGYWNYTGYIRVGYDNLNGWANAPTSHYFAGVIDEVRVLSREVSAIEVTNLFNTASPLTADEDTILLWHLDDEKVSYMSDEVALNGASYSQGVIPAAGLYNGAAYFSGNADFVSLPNGPMDFSTGFSASFWARPTSSPNFARFFDFNNGAPSNNILLSRYGTSSDLWFEIYNGASSAGGIRVTNGIINNEWHHYAVTVSTTGYVSIYRDGSLLQGGQIIAIPNAVRANKFIGRSPWGTDPYYAGYLDEFSLKNRVMSADEIRAEYNGYTLAEFNNEYLTQVIGKGVTFNVKGNFLLDSGSSIVGTGQGFPSDEGIGRGARGVGYSGGGGGGNGGNGGQGQGDGSNQPAAGGQKYGEQLRPITLGAGGGSSSQGASGGFGGGAFAVVAQGILEDGAYTKGNITVRGSITMDGTLGRTGSPGGGGGAGGSILLHGNTCDISGMLSARGGEGGNSDVDGGSGGGGRVSILYNSGPCEVSSIVSVAEGTPSDPANYSAQVGQIGTYPSEPNSVPWPSQYREQFEVVPAAQGATESNVVYALAESKVADVLGVTESVIPVGGVINGTTVTLKADAFDAGASIASPKRLKIQIELKKINQLFDGSTGVHDSDSVVFSGGAPVVLSVQIANLEMGASYKWRVRTVNIDNNLESEWLDFGDNAGNAADFTITTVAALDMQSPRTTIEFSDSGTVTVAALNSVGSVDTTYRGTIRFRSDSVSAQLPADYVFMSVDNGQRTFTNAIKFFEEGSHTVTVEDTVNGNLIDSIIFNVNAPRIPYLYIGASNTTITQGESTTLQWQSNYISNTSINNNIGSVSATGSVSVTPLVTTTYTVTGTNEQNQQMISSITITVEEVNPTISLTATPSTIVNGNSVTLAWNSEHLTNLTLDNGIGNVGATGSLVIFPTATTTYEISGTSILNETFRTSVTVTVNDLVGTISFTASATQVITGNATTLHWDSTNLTNLSINNDIGAVSATGSREVSPTTTTTYVITGQNVQTGETMNASVIITVLPVPDVATLSISASARSIQTGRSVTLQWQSAMLTNLSINNGIGAVSTNGTRSITPNATTTYMITGQRSDGSIMQASIRITVVPVVVPKTPSLGISASVSKIKVGETVTLQWQSLNVSDLSISAGVGSVGASGTKTVTPTATTTYEISGKTETGATVKASVTVQVTRFVPTGGPIVKPEAEICPVIVDFKVSAKLIKKGEEFTISWQVQNADKVAIDVFGSNLASSGSAALSLQNSQDITIFASKGACQKLQSKHIDVVSAYPWEGAGGFLIGVMALEAIGLQIGAAQGNLWLAIASLIDRAKKRTPWGVVYNAVTKKLIGRAIIRLWDTKTGRLVDTVVSDANGVFRFTPKIGKYVIKVTHPEFTYPSKLIAGDTDSGYSNIYSGEVIDVKSDQEVLTFAIPLDPVKKLNSELFAHYVTNFIDEVISLLSPVMLIAGFIYGIVVTYLYPITINYVIVGIYALLVVLKLITYLSRPKVYGTVTGVDGKIISGLELGLFDKEFNTLIARTFTNKNGGYNFVVKNEDYYLRIMDDKYKILSRNPSKEGYLIKKLLKFRGGVRLITENLMVYPLKK